MSFSLHSSYGDLDIEGTIKMAKDIYGSFTKFGSKSFLLLNRVAGYCVPRAYGLHSLPEKNNNHNNSITQVTEEGPIELVRVGTNLVPIPFFLIKLECR